MAKLPEIISFSSAIVRLKSAGFSISERSGGAILVTKYGCGAVVEKTASGQPSFETRPGLLVGDTIANLLDKGYQKVWQAGKRTLPAAAEQLKQLRQFEEDLRLQLGLKSLYNLALGTVSTRYVYDRVEGREDNKVHQSFD
jgi:hypothetical protein